MCLRLIPRLKIWARKVKKTKFLNRKQERKLEILETEEAGNKHEFDSALEELGEKGEDEMCDLESEEEIGVSEMKEAGKKRPVLETSDSEGKETKRDKKRNKKSDDFDELPISTTSMNMTKKERREYLDHLRA